MGVYPLFVCARPGLLIVKVKRHTLLSAPSDLPLRSDYQAMLLVCWWWPENFSIASCDYSNGWAYRPSSNYNSPIQLLIPLIDLSIPW